MKENNKVIINVNSAKITINPMVYSSFVEHIGECIHNGLWAHDPVNVPLIEDNPFLISMRKDVFQAVKQMKPSVLRAFGGCYSDVYHWKDAIGPRDMRKKIRNVMWGARESELIEGVGPDIDNQFGTDEFLTFCEEIRAEPYLNVNYGTGTPEEAAEWVDYCNGSIHTEYGALRAENGRRDPYKVKFWGIANEIYGFWEVGYEKNPNDYAKKYLEFAKKMRKKDPSIKLVACGWENSKWNQIVLKNIGEQWIDYLSIHRYFPFLAGTTPRKRHPENARCYHALMASTPLIESFIDDTWRDIVAALGKNTNVRISFDEWGMWYMTKDMVKANFNLQDGIWATLILMTFQKMSDKCPMANLSDLINTLSCAIRTDKNGLILTPIYYAFKLFTDHMFNNLLEDVKVDCITFDSRKYGRIPKRKNVPYIDCNANINDEGNKLSIMLVNKHFTDKLKVVLKLIGFTPAETGSIVKLSSASPFDYNTKECRNRIQIKEKEFGEIKPNMIIELAAHSVTVLKLTKK
ncbi:MAG: hypothetical protein EU535_02630 [Promethearchaeota archaeon]|nr:MAG: hypothetical protein EU535_02630 [Candidatus Lokiarchaeota archaeon]